jgi:hypothetical protein
MLIIRRWGCGTCSCARGPQLRVLRPLWDVPGRRPTEGIGVRQEAFCVVVEKGLRLWNGASNGGRERPFLHLVCTFQKLLIPAA